jgi:serine phosphatase RsbU (regulator of sigma subunit)
VKPNPLRCLLSKAREDNARGIADAILNAATAYAEGEPFDDNLTIIVIRRAAWLLPFGR